MKFVFEEKPIVLNWKSQADKSQDVDQELLISITILYNYIVMPDKLLNINQNHDVQRGQRSIPKG